MSSTKPPWWRAFDKVERAIGGPLEAAAESNRYVDVMVRGMKVQRTIGGGIGRLAVGVTDRVLRVANIPTRSDVRRINRQLAALTNEVRELAADHRESLAAQNAAAPKAAAPKPAKTKPQASPRQRPDREDPR